jgi:phospholipid/cholesterol/gamma-HCH transport system substrate-binding protein
MTPEAHDAGRGIRDQIRRYRTAFSAVLGMIVIAALVGGFILSNERLTLPGWVPVIGTNYFTLKGEFQTAQAVAPGQGQSVTIAGAKVGEIARVDLQQGVAVVTMHLSPKYAHYIDRDATMLLRPKTPLKDMTVEINPGTSAAGRVRPGGTIPVSQTAPDVNFDEFLSSLDTDTRGYLQELLAGLGEGLKNNGKALSATFKRFDPTVRDLREISQELAGRHAAIARSIHNFRLLAEALGGKDRQLAELVDSSNAVFATFAQEDHNFQSTLHLLPSTLEKTKKGLGKLATAASVLGPTLKKLHPFASALAPAQRSARQFFSATTPTFKNEIRPFARQVLPVVRQLQPSLQNIAQASPELSKSFSVLNELFNELAYNPGPNQAGFIFYLDWAAQNFNSVVSSADSQSALGHTLVYFNCNLLPILHGAAEVNPTVKLIVGLLNPPSGSLCPSTIGGASTKAASAASASGSGPALAGRVFGQGPDTFVRPSSALEVGEG